jgi:peptidoglycan/LPS O-acetylase OafA/YrhL
MTPWLWAIILVLFGLSFWGPYVHLLGDDSNLAPLYAFVVGVLSQHLIRRLPDIRPWLMTSIALLSIVLFWYCGKKNQTAPVLLIECLAAASLVVAVTREQLPFFKPLDFWPVRFYGRISYSFYLLHVLGILLASRLLGAAGLSVTGLPVSAQVVVTTLMAVLVTTAPAYLFWRFIEVPGISLGLRIGAAYAREPRLRDFNRTRVSST